MFEATMHSILSDESISAYERWQEIYGGNYRVEGEREMMGENKSGEWVEFDVPDAGDSWGAIGSSAPSAAISVKLEGMTEKCRCRWEKGPLEIQEPELEEIRGGRKGEGGGEKERPLVRRQAYLYREIRQIIDLNCKVHVKVEEVTHE